MKKICGDTNLNRVPHEQVRKLSKNSAPEGIRNEDLTHQLCNPLPLEHVLVCDCFVKKFHISLRIEIQKCRSDTASTQARSARTITARWPMPGHTGPVRQPSSRAMAHRLWKIIRHCKKLRCTRDSNPLPGGKELDCFTTELHLKLCVIVEVYLHILPSPLGKLKK
jgi:hypothetical protein